MMDPAPFDFKNILLSFLMTLGGCLFHIPPSSVVVSEPTSVTTAIANPYNALLMEIRKDQSVWYRITNPGTNQELQKINGDPRKKLAKIIKYYKATCAAANIKPSYLIKGHTDAGYPAFEKIISALKDNQEYKYELVTMKDE